MDSDESGYMPPVLMIDLTGLSSVSPIITGKMLMKR